MRQPRSLSGERPLVQRQQTKHAGVERLDAFSSSAVARSRATCRINGNNFTLVSPSSSSQRGATPTIFLFCFLSFPSTRFAFSWATRTLVSLRLFQRKRTEARAASRTRGEHLSRSRAVLRQSDRGTVQVRGCGATAVRDDPGDEKRPRMFWEIAFRMKRGFFSAVLASSLWII